MLKLHTTESVVETTTTTSPSVFKTAMDTVQTKPATEPLAKPVTSVAGKQVLAIPKITSVGMYFYGRVVL